MIVSMWELGNERESFCSGSSLLWFFWFFFILPLLPSLPPIQRVFPTLEPVSPKRFFFSHCPVNILLDFCGQDRN